MESLPLFHRLTGVPVVVVGEGEAAEAKRRLVRNAGALPATADDPQARLAFVACDAPEAMVAELRGRGLLVNCVDRPDLCDFTVPALIDRAPVLVAVGTSGASAGLAKAVRLRLERLLPPRLGDLARALFAARPALRRRFADAGERRRALDVALGEQGALDPFDPASADRVAAWLVGAAEALANGLVTAVVPRAELLAEANRLAREIADNAAPVSVAMIRQMLWRGLGLSHPMEAHRIESRAIYARSRSGDAVEGVKSFLEKRAPDFPGRVSADMPDFYPWWEEPDYF